MKREGVQEAQARRRRDMESTLGSMRIEQAVVSLELEEALERYVTYGDLDVLREWAFR